MHHPSPSSARRSSVSNRTSSSSCRDPKDRTVKLGDRPAQVSRDDVVVVPEADDEGPVDLTSVLDGADGLVVDGTAGLTVGTSALRRYRLVGVLLVPIDIACLTIALLVAHALRFG